MLQKPSKARLENGARSVCTRCVLGAFVATLGSGGDWQAAGVGHGVPCPYRGNLFRICSLSQGRINAGQPERHIHRPVQRQGGRSFGLGVCRLCMLAVQIGETEMTVGQ